MAKNRTDHLADCVGDGVPDRLHSRPFA